MKSTRKRTIALAIMKTLSASEVEGLLLIDKPKGKTSFWLIKQLRRILNVKKIGHAGTLDPFATGLMILLVGRNYTKLSDSFLNCDKEYVAEVHLGVATDTFDCEGQVTAESDSIPSDEEIKAALAQFQGEIEQVPPMFSALKRNGKKLYELARQGKVVEREPRKVRVETTLIDYCYPKLIIRVSCSKGTYIRSIADDLGKDLGCGAHLTNLRRTRSGEFQIHKAFGKDLELVTAEDITPHLQKQSA